MTSARNSEPLLTTQVVGIGGGHGLAASLRALRRITGNVTAIVGVSDDGGSSGRLRKEFNVPPPGDLRMALAALCQSDSSGNQWNNLIQHRFDGGGELHGHALGNLIMTALWQQYNGDVVMGLDTLAQIMGVQGRVLPVAEVPLEIVADVLFAEDFREYSAQLDELDPAERTVVRVRGQVAVATTRGQVLSISVLPENPPACPEAVAAIYAADTVVLGPGSWFTSVLPAFAIPELRKALIETTAQRILVLNLCAQTGETSSFRPETHVEVLERLVPELRLDAVIAHTPQVPDVSKLEAACARLGAKLYLEDLAIPAKDGEQSCVHDTGKLSTAMRKIIQQTWQGTGRVAWQR